MYRLQSHLRVVPVVMRQRANAVSDFSGHSMMLLYFMIRPHICCNASTPLYYAIISYHTLAPQLIWRIIGCAFINELR